MADELQLEPVEGSEEEKAGTGGKKKLIIIGIIALVLLAGIGAGVWFFLKSDAPATDKAATEKQPSTEMQALYVALPQPFVFNVPGDNGDRLVQIKVQLMVRGAENEGLVKQHLPLVESVLLQTFSTFNEEQLSTAQGRETLRSKSQQAVDKALTNVTGKSVLERVLFTGFVMQ
ncbi:flagellar basal body-associated protein FliL [Gallaecimonas sp. GXIMD1310]|uniref:flagellar basal body-associated protein FliL n=1 Tax=Gallaecimonas sp. GXIMD1310 TaxID=3131926 RepID=UPI003246B7AC